MHLPEISLEKLGFLPIVSETFFLLFLILVGVVDVVSAAVALSSLVLLEVVVEEYGAGIWCRNMVLEYGVDATLRMLLFLVVLVELVLLLLELVLVLILVLLLVLLLVLVPLLELVNR